MPTAQALDQGPPDQQNLRTPESRQSMSHTTQEEEVGPGMADLPRVSEPAQGPTLFTALQNNQG